MRTIYTTAVYLLRLFDFVQHVVYIHLSGFVYGLHNGRRAQQNDPFALRDRFIEPPAYNPSCNTPPGRTARRGFYVSF